MKVLFKELRNSKDLTRVLNYCKNNRIETIHNGSSLTLDDIQLEEFRGVINWGGYGSSFKIGSNLFNYFKLDYPGGPPPRGKNFTHVKMVMNGTLDNNNTEKVIQKVEKLGGLVVQDVDDKVNLMVIGEKADKQLLKKAEELNQVLILDEERFMQILPARLKFPVKRQIKPRKVLPQTVDKKVLRNLKKLFTSRDNDLINQGHEVLRSLENNDIYNYFLDGVEYTPQDDIGLVPNSMFTRTGTAQPFLNYALLGVIAYAPEGCEIAVNIRQSIISLQMVLSSIGLLDEFKKLESLDLSGSSSIENLDGLTGCTKLTSLTFREASFTSLPGGLEKIPRLKHLNLNHCESLQNVDGLANLPNLTSLSLSRCNIKKVDFLVSLTKLTHLNLDNCFYIFVPPKTDIMTSREEVIEYQDKIRLVMALRDGDAEVLSDYKDITKLDLDNCFDSLENLDGLVNFSKLASLKLNGNSLSVPPKENEMDTRKQVSEYQDKIRIFMALRDGNTNVVNGYKDSTSIDLSSCKFLKNLDLIANCTQLTELDLSNCDSLENVRGLVKCTNLTSLNLSECGSLQNIYGLENCTKLTKLGLSGCRHQIFIESFKAFPKLFTDRHPERG
jgi:internalin A